MKGYICISQGASLNGTTQKSRNRSLSSVEIQRLSWTMPGRLAAGKLKIT